MSDKIVLRFMSDAIKNEALNRFNQNKEAIERLDIKPLKRFLTYKPKKILNFFNLFYNAINLEIDGNILYPCENPIDYCQSQVDEFLKNKHKGYTTYEKENDYFGHVHYRYLNECYDILDNYKKTHDLQTTYTGDKSIPHLLILGVGLGYVLELLLSKVSVNSISIIESDDDLFYASLFTFEWAPLLDFLNTNNIDITFIVGKDATHDCLLSLYTKFEYEGKFLSGFSKAFVHYVNDDIKDLVKTLMPNFKNIFAMMGFYDDHLFGISHGIRAIQDGNHFIKNEVSDLFKSYPVFIIGNGPSLDNDLSFIRENQDKAIIVASGSAIDTLYSAGVEVDFYVALERSNDITQIFTHMQKSYFDDIVLIATDVIHPVTTKFFKHSALIFKNDEPFYELIKKFNLDIPIDKVLDITYINPLVSNLALASMLKLGFKNLYLFGIDNGKKAQYANIHASSSKIYSKDYYGDIEFSDIYTTDSHVKGNFGGIVESNYLYQKSLLNLNMALKSYGTDKKCFNCSDGAFIEGACPLMSQDIDTSSFKDIDKKAFLNDFIKNNTMLFSIDDGDIEKIIDKDGFYKFLDSEIKCLKESIDSFKTRSDLISFLILRSKNLFKASYDISYSARLMTGSYQYFFIEIASALYSIDNESDAIDIAKKMLYRFMYFLEDGRVLYKYMPSYIQNEHLKIFNGKLGFDHEKSKAPDAIKDYRLDCIHKGIDPFVKRYS